MAEPDPEKEIEVAYELSDGWMWVRLSDVINDFQPGFACGARDDHGYVQLRMNNIGLDGCVVLEKTLRVPIEKTNMGKYNLRIGDILFNNTNSVELIGKTALFRDEVQNCVFSNHITRIRPYTRLINSKYLLNVFINDYNNGIFRMMCHRFVGQAGISRKKLLEHTFPLPPLPEQHRIVAKLEALLAQVNRSKDHLAKVPLLIKRFRQSVLAAACSGRLTEDWRREHPDVEPALELLNRIREERIRRYNEECRKAEAEGRRKPKNNEPQVVDTEGLPELPEGWLWTKLGDLNETTSGGTPKRSNKDYYGGDIPWLKSGELEDNVITKAEETITELGLKKSSAKIFPTGTLLIALYGATVGKTGKLAIESATNQAICGIFNEGQVFYDQYLWHYLISFRNNLIEKSFGGAQPNISQGIIQNLNVPLPPLAEQRVIVEQVETLFHFADEVEQRVAAATTHTNHLTQSILARTFRGELVPQDPCDEPASVLLERIKQERAKNEMEKKTGKRKTKTLLDYC